MKKTFITAICFLLLFAVSAQKTQLGLMVGGANSNFKTKSEDEDLNGDAKTGMSGGIVANFSLSEKCSLRSGLMLVQKGSKVEETIGGYKFKAEINTNWLEVPVSLTYNTGKFFVGAGPSLSFGVGGKWKSKVDDEEEESGKVSYGNSDEDNLKGFDFGANVLAGFQFDNGIFIVANFNQGFSNLTAGDSDGSMKSHYFGLHLGYMFKGKN